MNDIGVGTAGGWPTLALRASDGTDLYIQTYLASGVTSEVRVSRPDLNNARRTGANLPSPLSSYDQMLSQQWGMQGLARLSDESKQNHTQGITASICGLGLPRSSAFRAVGLQRARHSRRGIFQAFCRTFETIH